MSRSIQSSIDGGVSWQVVAQVNGATFYTWTVPSTPTNQGLIKVVDGNGVVATSGTFIIMAAGVVNKVMLSGLDANHNIGTGKPMTITWNAAGALGETLSADVSYDNNVSWTPIVNGYSYSAQPSYVWTTSSTYYPRATVRLVFASGATGYSDPFSIGSPVAVADGTFRNISGVAPNPFASTTSFSYTLSAGYVSLIVCDLPGREVGRVNSDIQSPGSHQLTFDGTKLSQGHYAYRLVAGSSVQEGMLTIVR